MILGEWIRVVYTIEKKRQTFYGDPKVANYQSESICLHIAN